ncbi:MAG TPA: hypothetical protein VK422_17365 [Pyrinomonadaceae bacterium]|nr:hypothetical protein [Pyrinomonadaceae bacterium]
MTCEDCGTEMNLHAEKVDWGTDSHAGEPFDEELGGVVEEFHTCPDCGTTEARVVL